MREKSNYMIIYYVTVTTNISQETLQIDEPELSYIQLRYIVVQPQILKETTIKQHYTPKCLTSCSLSNCFFCQVSLLIFYKAGKAKRKEKRSACRRPVKQVYLPYKTTNCTISQDVCVSLVFHSRLICTLLRAVRYNFEIKGCVLQLKMFE